MFMPHFWGLLAIIIFNLQMHGKQQCVFQETHVSKQLLMESRRNTENIREWIWPYTKCLIPRNSWILDSLPKTNNLLSKMLVGRWFSFLEWSLFAGNIWIFVEIPSKILGQVAANALPGEPTGISDRKSCCRPCHVDSLHEDQQKKHYKKNGSLKIPGFDI